MAEPRRTGVWLIAGTPTSRPYPCRCDADGRCNPRWCPCAGRMDLEHTPAGCCARRFSPALRVGGRDA